MVDIHNTLIIDAPAAEVYEALASADQIGRWWDKQTAVQTNRGLVLEHNPGPEHGVVRLRVVEQIPNQRVEWECISTHPMSSPASAWTGTHFIFELSEQAAPGIGGATTLDFYHAGYNENSEFYEFNKAAWVDVLQNLKQVVESARG